MEGDYPHHVWQDHRQGQGQKDIKLSIYQRTSKEEQKAVNDIFDIKNSFEQIVDMRMETKIKTRLS